MKQFESGELTAEDRTILKRGSDHPELGMERKIRALIGIQSDRQSAVLMLLAQDIAQFGPTAINLHGIPCRGWDQE